MKRFLHIICAFLGICLGGLYLFFYQGFYVQLNPDAPIDIVFKTEEKDMMLKQEDGSFTSFEIKGVDVTAALPGYQVSAYAPKKADYLRWMKAIADMGANTLRVYNVMDDDFYEALYEFNSTVGTPLYLLQGIQVSDIANMDYKDAYGDAFLGSLLEDGRLAVDVIHGRKISPTTISCGGGKYYRDVSDWTIGYLVGLNWNADTIAYTDNNVIHSGIYEGEFFTTTQDATPFEALLAQVLDSIVSYENDKYCSQHPVAFNCAPDIDFMEFEDVYVRQSGKYVHVNAEHIVPTDKVQAGYFAAYRIFDFVDGFENYLEPEQKKELAPFIKKVSAKDSYSGYLELLSAYHTMPVVISGFSASTARGVSVPGGEPFTEEEQGENLMAVWKEAMDAGWSGMCISTWQDAWDRRSWNTAFAVESGRSHLWHDLQCDSQNIGLLAFEPGKEPVCVIDGNPAEWNDEEAVLSDENRSLFIRYDQRGLYLLVKGVDVGTNMPLYLPIDMTKEVGNSWCEEPLLTFNRKADFVLCLQGIENSRLLVQERYDATRENFNYESGGTNPFLDIPDIDSPVFVTETIVYENNILVENPGDLTLEKLREMHALGVRETGRLVHGNGNPDAEDYNSLADFCYGENCVEVRIPWLLLNVSDPTAMMVHRDYYTQYGVVSEHIPAFYIGLGDGKEEIALSSVDTIRWDWESDWRERFKQSYYIVREHWK